MSEKGPKIGLKVGSRVRSTWGAFPRSGVITGKVGDRWRVRFAEQNLIRICGAGEIEPAVDNINATQPRTERAIP